jgi:phage tail-like protein
LIEGLPSPFPTLEALPALLQDDAFIQRFSGGIDAVMAPIYLTLDNLDAYFDPGTAPADFLGWLADWVGVAIDENWPLDRQRALVAGAVDLFQWRGTRRGLAAHVVLYTGVEPEIEESGGCEWSLTPGSAPPGNAQPELVVRVRVADPATVDTNRLDRIVSASKPAHVPHRVEVVQP